MTTPRVDKNEPKTPARLTSYAIYRVAEVPIAGDLIPWITAGSVEAHSAQDAIRRWANLQNDTWPGGPVMAVPSRSVTIAQATVETKRQITLGAP